MCSKEWLETAKELPVNTKERIDCDCGTGKTMVVNHNVKEYSAYCFRCGRKEYEYKGMLNLMEIEQLRELDIIKSELTGNAVKLPLDFTTDIPLLGRLWLYKCGLTETKWRKYGIGYSERHKRVFMPIYNKGLVWFQARALYADQQPKYLQPSANRESIMFISKPSKYVTNDIVICEDIMSAIRVGEHCTAVSILGTKITTAQVNRLLTGCKKKQGNIITWLDSDQAGRQGAIELRKALSMFVEVHDIVTEKDPKLLSDSEIIERIIEKLRK